MCYGGNILVLIFHEGVAFAACFPGYLTVVLHLGETVGRTSGDDIPCIISLPFPFPFVKFPQVPSGLWVTSGECCGVWRRPSGISTGLVMLHRHPCCCMNPQKVAAIGNLANYEAQN